MMMMMTMIIVITKKQNNSKTTFPIWILDEVNYYLFLFLVRFILYSEISVFG